MDSKSVDDEIPGILTDAGTGWCEHFKNRSVQTSLKSLMVVIGDSKWEQDDCGGW